MKSNIKNQTEKEEYLNKLNGISIEPGVYYASYPLIDKEEALENNRKAKEEGLSRGVDEMVKFVLKLKGFLESDLNKEEKEKIKPIVSAGTNYHAGGDIIIGNNNKNVINEIDKLLDLINKSDLNKKTEIVQLLEDFKKSNDKTKLVDAFSVLGSGASINSMIIALGSLLN